MTYTHWRTSCWTWEESTKQLGWIRSLSLWVHFACKFQSSFTSDLWWWKLHIAAVTLKCQIWHWDWQLCHSDFSDHRVIDWILSCFISWLESPCSICYSPAWDQPTRHLCARPGSPCTALWCQPWPEAGPKMVNTSPTEQEVDVRFTLEHLIAIEVTRCNFSKKLF